MQKKEAIDIIVKCAELYHTNLENRNLLFVFGNEHRVEKLETIFLKRNYLHLTGIIPEKSKITSANDFYKICIEHELKEDYFSLAYNVTEMKLSILIQMMNIHKSAKMIGNYNFNKPQLYTEMLAGNVFGCMGFVKEGHLYIPNTVIKEDIRDITEKPQKRMMAIFSKKISEKWYNKITYLAKDVDLDMLGLSELKNFSQSAKKQDTVRKPLNEQLLEAKRDMKKNSVHIPKKSMVKKELIK